MKQILVRQQVIEELLEPKQVIAMCELLLCGQKRVLPEVQKERQRVVQEMP